MKRILQTILLTLATSAALALLCVIMGACNILWNRYVTGWVSYLPWLVPLALIANGAWQSTAKHKAGCAKCDRGDGQLGHSDECPNAPGSTFHNKSVIEAHFQRIRESKQPPNVRCASCGRRAAFLPTGKGKFLCLDCGLFDGDGSVH